ncbi:Mitochondrial import inner membrane translocase subunit Tim17 [Hordeum vulgare]|nr:Mitochondrial import inner membrane translocase subunit Tim17 [Hordeum vulgare]
MPAPNVINEVSDAAIVGAVLGSVVHFVQGVCTSPNGSRLAGGFRAVNALSVGRWAALCGAAKSTICTVQHVSPGYPFEITVTWESQRPSSPCITGHAWPSAPDSELRR